MDDYLMKILESKQAMRAELADLPFREKIVILEKLRDREMSIMESRRFVPSHPSAELETNKVETFAP